MERVSPQGGWVRRLGLPANSRCGGWATCSCSAGHFCDTAAMVSWREALAWHRGARAAVLEVDPLPSVLLHLWVDPSPWAPNHLKPPPLPLWFLQPHIFSPAMQRWASTYFALGSFVSSRPWNLRASKLSELWVNCWGPCVYRACNKWQ